jgi:hypothetical protein
MMLMTFLFQSMNLKDKLPYLSVHVTVAQAGEDKQDV